MRHHAPAPSKLGSPQRREGLHLIAGGEIGVVPREGVEGAHRDPARTQLLRRDAQEPADVRAYEATIMPSDKE